MATAKDTRAKVRASAPAPKAKPAEPALAAAGK